LTEYGYQTNPPDLFIGVSPAQQANYYASAALRVYRATAVAMLIYFIVRDDSSQSGWQSGFFTSDGLVKPSYSAFRLPLVQTARHEGKIDLWGQVRPRSGRQPFRVRLEDDERTSWLGATRWTDENGFFSLTVSAPRGARVRIWSPRDNAYGYELVVR
jgi:hypothetical protein